VKEKESSLGLPAAAILLFFSLQTDRRFVNYFHDKSTSKGEAI
jgi:hypothetical protein